MLGSLARFLSRCSCPPRFACWPTAHCDSPARQVKPPKSRSKRSVFAWTAFWWLDHYAGLRRHLREHYRSVLENDRVVVFDLQAPAGSQGA